MTDELDWIAAQQPPTDGPDPTATAAARAALLDHAERAPASAASAAAPPATAPGAQPRHVTTRPRRARRRRATALALATVAVVAVAAVGLPLGVDLGGDGGSGSGDGLRIATDRAGGVLAPAVADAAPLKRLSARIAALPDQPGDATLAVHRNSFPDGRAFSGADLYLDDGTYYYAETPAGLRGASGETPVDMPWAAIIRATRAAAGEGPQQARAGLLRAAQFKAVPGAPPAGLDGKQLRDPGAARPTLREREDNMIWVTAMDVLAAGGSRADVRAGVLRLLATIPTVVLDETRGEDGRRLLRLRSTSFRGDYLETLWLDADTGVLERMEGGAPGRRPDVVVRYEIERVSAAELLGR